VKVCLEGLPQHAWFRAVADKVLGDEYVIYHVDEATVQRSDQRSYDCWALSEDPSIIPQSVFLSLLDMKLTQGEVLRFI
jgi:hypothetical protein